MNAPFFYDYINSQVWDHVPSTVHVKDSAVTHYFVKYFLQKAIAVFKWKLPDEWHKDYFKYCLYCYGFIAVINTDKYGVIPQHCTLTGRDVFYAPTNAVIANPLLKGNLTPRIDEECSLIRLMPDYGSIMDIVWYYAGQMALAMETASVNMFNSKLSYMFFGNGKASAETWKKVFDQIAAGQPAVYPDLKMRGDADGKFWEPFCQDVKSNYIYSDIICDMRKVEAEFDTRIGIPNANTDKRERLITDEVNANNTETKTLASQWLEEIKYGVDKTNKLFGTNITVDWRFKEDSRNVSFTSFRDSVGTGTI